MPFSVSFRSRAVRTLRAMPRLAWKSSKRRVPRKASRRISGVHHSPTTSSVFAIEQFHSARLVNCMSAAYLSKSFDRTHSFWQRESPEATYWSTGRTTTMMTRQITRDRDIEALKIAARWPAADRTTIVTLATKLAASRADADGYAFFQAEADTHPDRATLLALAGFFQARLGEDTGAALAKLDKAAAADLGLPQYFRGLALAFLPPDPQRAGQAVADLEFVLAVRDQFPPGDDPRRAPRARRRRGIAGDPAVHPGPAAARPDPRSHAVDRTVHHRGHQRPAGRAHGATRRGTRRHPRRPRPSRHPGRQPPARRAPRPPQRGRAVPGDPGQLRRPALPPAHRILAAGWAGTGAAGRGRPRRGTRPAGRGSGRAVRQCRRHPHWPGRSCPRPGH